MLINTIKKVKPFSQLAYKSAYCLLDHNYIKDVKTKLYHEQQPSMYLKLKFILKETKYTLFQGCKDLYTDSKWLVSLYRKKKLSQLTGFQKVQSWRITTDLLKFIPYSILLIIPFAQVFIPVIIWVFPNAVPSFFIFDTAQDKRIEILEQQQQQSHSILVQKLLDVLRQDFKKQQQFVRYDAFKRDFFEVIDQLNVRLNYKNFNSDQLIHILRFLGGNFMTGTATINKIVNLFTMTIPRFSYKIYRYFKYKIKKQAPPPYQDPFFVVGNFRLLQFNYFPFEFFKKRFLIFQIQQHLKSIKNQDAAFERFGMNDIAGYNVKHFARQRGIPAISCYETLKNIIRDDWVKVTTHPKFTQNTKLWYAVMMYNFINKTNKDLN